MRSAHRLLCALLVVVSFMAVRSSAASAPILFEKNEGQFPREVDYVARATGQAFLLEGNRATVATGPAETPSQIRMTFVAARPDVAPTGGALAPSRTHYIRGNDRSQWLTGVAAYHSVRYDGLYPGIDVEYHARRGMLEYDFIVAPGADWRHIAILFEGAKPVLDANGDLVLDVAGKEVRQHAPVVYQEVGGERKTVAGKYVVDGNRVSFDIGAFDRTRPLVIDPILDFNRVIQPLLNTRPWALAFDSAGRIYMLGTVYGPAAFSMFPSSTSSYGNDIIVTRLSADGTAVDYTTVFGGDRAESAIGLATDSLGNVYATGITESANFPTTPGVVCETVKDTFEINTVNYRTWVVKLDATSGNVLWSTYIERPLQNLVNTQPRGIAVDGNGFPIIVGNTSDPKFPVTQAGGGFAYITKLAKDGESFVFSKRFSGNIFDLAASPSALYMLTSGFATTPGVYAPSATGNLSQLAKYDMSGNKIWVTYWPTLVADLAVDSGQNLITIGKSTNAGFPTTGTSYQQNLRGSSDIYIAKLSANGTTMLASTYFGGTGVEDAFGVAAGPLDSVVLTGSSNSLDIQVPGALQSEHTELVGGVSNDPIVAKFDSTLSTLLFNTFWGPTPRLVAPLVDSLGNIVIAGFGAGTGTWLKGPQPPHAAIEGDAYVARINVATNATMRIDSIVPAAVVNDSGGTVDIRGHGFVPGAKIYFGATEMSGPTVNVTAGGTRLRAHVPNASPGRVDIVIKNPDGSLATKPQAFEHLAAFHVLSSVTPTSITTLGGPVTITGSGFPANPGIAMEPKPIDLGRDLSSTGPTSISFIMPPTIRPNTVNPVTSANRFRILFPRGDLFSNRGIDIQVTQSPLPVINAVRPTAGPTTGGGSMTITGNNFSNNARVLVGNVHSKNVTFIDQFTLLADIPPNTGGLAEIRVMNVDGGTAVRTGAYTYRGLTSITPVSGPVAGGQTVTINGFGFAAAGNVVSFGGTAATNVTYVSDTQLTAVTPAHTAGFVDVVVTSNSETYTLADAYRYLDPAPTVSSISPTAGPNGGGTAVTVTGTGFQSGAEVFIGGVKATNVSFVSATQLNATTAASPAGTFDVIVTNPDQQSVTKALAFTYRGINNVAPAKGSPGTIVNINGGGFESGATVTFGGTAASNVTFVNAGKLVATAPDVPEGEVDVVVTNPGGAVMTLPNGFRFLPPAPTITNFTPASGFPGDSVTITGTDFTLVTEVTFDNIAALYTVDSATQITATVPNGATTGPIGVTTESGTGTSASSFTVLEAAAEITSFTPASGGEGTTVVITGDKLAGASAVTFGGIPAQQFEANSRTQLTAIVAANSISGPICIATPGPFNGCSATDFLVPPRVTSFTPGTGAPGTSITITGANFTGATEVTFNGTAATFTVDSATQITATVPANASSGPIGVTTPAGSGASVASFGVPPVISSFTPTAAPFGATVTVSGVRFLGATQVTFNGTSAAFTVVSATSITATVPNGATDGPIAVTTPAGSDTSVQPFNVTFPPTITSFTPAKGDPGTLVTITGTDLGAATQVKFNGVPASFTIVSATQITATVPNTATNGPISITNAEGSGTSSGIFSLAPVLSSFAPNAGAVGTTVTLSGNNFLGTTLVKFNTVEATFVVNTNEKITATVPATATNGAITVTTGYGAVSSTFSFTVLSASTPTVIATATSATSVSVSWTGDPTHTYDVRRITMKNENFTSNKIATVIGSSYVDTSVLAGRTYLYNIRDVTTGAIGNNDFATTIAFTDATLSTATIIKAVHFSELRSAVNAMRVAAALPAATFTDASLSGLPFRRVHVNELRTALNEALIQLGRFAKFTDSELTVGMPVRGVHVRELREAVK